MKTETKVLKCLMQGMKSCTIKELSRLTGADYKITHTAVQRLAKKGIIKTRAVGNSIEASFAPKFTQDVFEAEMERRQELLKKANFRVILSHLDELKFPMIALVFGSHAKGTAARHSDIDLMIICDKEHEKAAESEISVIGLDMHHAIFTYDEFLQMANSREFTVVSEAMKDRIIMTGIEYYYRLIKDVG